MLCFHGLIYKLATHQSTYKATILKKHEQPIIIKEIELYQMKQSEQLMMMRPTTLMMLQRKCSIRSYGCNEVFCSPVNVPFSWEYRPGLSKVARQRSKKDAARHNSQSALSPPPCSLTGPYSVRAVGDRKEAPPLILCAVQMRENNHHQREDDPFLKAYKNCTQSPLKLSTTSTATAAGKRSFNWSNISKYMHALPCYSAHAC